MRRFVLIFFFFLAVQSLSAQQTLSPEVQAYVKTKGPAVALTRVRVIDGTGAAAKENQTVVIRDGKIASVGGSASAIPKDAEVLDLNGYSVIPGLVGMHDHLFYPMGGAAFGEMPYSFPRLYLASGVTTIRTGGSIEPYTDLEIKKAIDAGTMPGPKMHVTGPYIEGKGTFALQLHQLEGPDDASRTVKYWVGEGVDSFKVYNYVTPEELFATISMAHGYHKKVTGHLCSIGFRQAAALGIDNLEHGLLVDTEFFPWKKPDECPNPTKDDYAFIAKLDVNQGPVHDMILDLVERKVAITSTLPVFEVDAPGRPTIQKRVLDALSVEARNRFLANKVRSSDAAAIKAYYGTEISPSTAALKKEMEFEYAFVKAGGLLLAGEDPTGMGGILAGFGDQREVELLVEAGFTPLEAIQIATSNGAQFLGDIEQTGTIAVGKHADLVVVKGDPSTKIEDIENVEIVFKDGVGYDSAKLIESVRGLVGTR